MVRGFVEDARPTASAGTAVGSRAERQDDVRRDRDMARFRLNEW